MITHRSFLLKDGGFSRLILKDAPWFCPVFTRVHFTIWRTPLISADKNENKNQSELSAAFETEPIS